MAHEFLPFDRGQGFLMPPSIDEWLPAGHPVRFVVDAVATLDLSAFEAAYQLGGVGRRAYAPEMMVGLLVWAYANGVFSSREIERRCVADVTFRFVTANQAPDHGTVARFRHTHERALKELHAQVLAMCASVGLVRVGVVALDGTKLSANASSGANRTMSWLDGRIEEWFAEADRVDGDEDDAFGGDRGDETPEDLADRDRRLARLREARDRLAAERAAKGPTTSSGRERTVNITDPASALVPTQRGFIQGYNAQAVATTGRVVLATGLNAAPGDEAWLHPMLAAAVESLTAAGVVEPIEAVVADAGYYSADNIDANGDDGPELFIATGSRKELATPVKVPVGAQPDDRLDRYQHRRDAIRRWIAGDIDYRQAAAKAGVSVPRIYALRHAFETDRDDRLGVRQPPQPDKRTTTKQTMRAKLDSERGRQLYRQRSPSIEGVFADRKQRLGFRRFSRRGIAAAESEWAFINTVGNLDKARRAITALLAFLTARPALA